MGRFICLGALFLIPVMLVSCSGNSTKDKRRDYRNTASGHSTTVKIDTAYMRTGFYFLSDEEGNGVGMREQGSDNVYSLSKLPFASVDNIRETTLETIKHEQGDYNELCMLFDAEGTNDLEEATGNSQHPQIAVVIAGKLFYVVDNSSKIKTGVMCVSLVGYTIQDMEWLKKAVDQKK